jgi:hypothetical protein
VRCAASKRHPFRNFFEWLPRIDKIIIIIIIITITFIMGHFAGFVTVAW